MKKLFAILLLSLILGLPILQTWKMLVLLAGILAIIYSDIRLNKWCFVILAAVLIIKPFLPVAGIEEGHNIFLILKEGEALEKGLSPEPFNSWKRAFDQLYPPGPEPYAWNSAEVPGTTFAYSSDSIWRPAKYSRVVDTISFKNLAEFRGGFINELKYNWWQGRLRRPAVPFFVMYEFSEASVGSVLAVMGQRKTILDEDVGKPLYIFVPGRIPNFSVELQLNNKLKASHIIKIILTIAGVLVLLGMNNINWKPYLTSLSIVGVAMLLIQLSGNTMFPLGASYPAHMGGNDGLFHESKGRDMARLISQGEVKEALRGGEDVYWFTPGTRYFRAGEKIFFGDTNLGYTMFLAIMPWVIYLIFSGLAGSQWALFGTVFFLFSFIQHVFLGMIGFGEPVGTGLFFVGLCLFMRSQPDWGGEIKPWTAFIGGLCLAGSVFVRPNYAIAVIVLGIFYSYACGRDFKRMGDAWFGLSFALLMPLHNWIYGGKFVLITASSNMNLSPKPMIEQLSGWFWAVPFVSNPLPWMAGISMAIKFIALPVTVYAAIRGRKLVFVLAWVAIAAHATMLFINPANVFRYSILGWDLSTILTIMLAVTFLESRQQGGYIHHTFGEGIYDNLLTSKPLLWKKFNNRFIKGK